MDIYTFLIEALRYPHAGWSGELAGVLEKMSAGEQQSGCRQFLDAISILNLAQCEELYTRTFDLNPQVAPYIGYQVWGDSYRRGAFMSSLNRNYRELGIDSEGELPDHLLPVLHYLRICPAPFAELQEIFQPALQKMIRDLKKNDSGNPYLHLLKAILLAVKLPEAGGESLQKTNQDAALLTAEVEFFAT